ncbi:MAG: hypothetical protein KZQ99_11135 [Candidatus Thiodiazotropha sp. (ex Dulcina madagascariensis)]|nr:hypothetical protein [Candidatus Thiodiazotropha sp. (ex Dulcina madagascariensis)]
MALDLDNGPAWARLDLATTKAGICLAGYGARRIPQQAAKLTFIVSTLAGEKGGFGALSLVKQAKKLLERAEIIDPDALDGSIYTSLGSLYYQVPGWSIGFGSDDKARDYLLKALAVNPTGMDPNFFYGDFLFQSKQHPSAVEAFEKALQATPRIHRPLADAGRMAEIETALAKAREQLK